MAVNINDLAELLVIKLSELTQIFSKSNLNDNALFLTQIGDDTGRVAAGEIREWILDSPTITGVASVPTAISGTTTTQPASTEFVANAISAVGLGTATEDGFGTVKTDETDLNPTVYLKSSVDTLLAQKAGLTDLSSYLPLVGGTLTGNLALSPGNLTANGGTFSGVLTAGGVNVGANISLIAGTGAINATTLVATGQISGLQAVFNGAITAGSLSTTGNISGAAITASGALTATSGTISAALNVGTLNATNLNCSTTLVSNSSTVGLWHRLNGSTATGIKLASNASGQAVLTKVFTSADTTIATFDGGEGGSSTFTSDIRAKNLSLANGINFGIGHATNNLDKVIRFASSTAGATDAQIIKTLPSNDFYVQNNNAGTLYLQNNAGDTLIQGGEVRVNATTSKGLKLNLATLGANTINYAGFYLDDGIGLGHETNIGVHCLISNPASPSNASVGTFTINFFSDGRIKRNVKPVKRKEIFGIFQGLEVVNFRYRNGADSELTKGREQIGMIAQTVEAVLPELVYESRRNISDSETQRWDNFGFEINEDDTGKYVMVKGVRYSDLAIYNTAMIQEVIDEVLNLRRRVKLLEDQLNPE